MKKTIAYILIAVVAIGAIYYLYNNKGSAAPLGTKGGTPYEQDDDAAYNSMRSLIPAGDLAWVEPLVKERYEATPELIAGQKSKAATFLRTVGAVAPNQNGKYPPVSWSNGMPILWPDATMAKLWDIQNSLTAKYNKI